ncbi:uncharacterized protein BXZ73DRAFT_41184 [Epithele typhae]|uniref:uncharacterized protein n=1 Tax=Epithele typhae TaxID=378194 RepID=UPI002007A93D|nr:uncharacterized protein BXZ73DRAFT_41184 [Epithele typhae]KAH9942525.1 hypothetical protein BXZ73DRAFT_41184 [Epithele typhae]
MPPATSIIDALTSSQSAEIALHGQRALTPILSGAISGGLVGVAWIIGIIVWLYKRHRRSRAAKAAGFRSHREYLKPAKNEDAFILPPDPAVLRGVAAPGEKFIVEEDEDEEGAAAHGDGEKHHHGKRKHTLKHARTVPEVEAEGETRVHGEKELVPPGMDHRSSAPTRLPDVHSGETNGDGKTP